MLIKRISANFVSKAVEMETKLFFLLTVGLAGLVQGIDGDLFFNRVEMTNKVMFSDQTCHLFPTFLLARNRKLSGAWTRTSKTSATRFHSDDFSKTTL